MRIEVKCETTINAPASKVWHVIAHEFENVDQWSSGLVESRATLDKPVLDGAKVSGRVCISSPGFISIDEVSEE